MKLVCISDTHGDHANVQLPDGDVLVHAGDITAHGIEQDLEEFLQWFSEMPHKHKMFIAGNHDRFLERSAHAARQYAEDYGVTWLNDSGITIDGVNFWGSPITLRFHDWSFMRDPGDDIARHWSLIPKNTDVLITHGPPFGILDHVKRLDGSEEQTGCPQLLETVLVTQPKVHIFGHIHEEYGVIKREGVEFLNVSTMNQSYRISNDPVVYYLR